MDLPDLERSLCGIARVHTSSTDGTINWNVVSREFIRHVSFLQRTTVTTEPKCRSAIHVIDPMMFTPRLCQQRVRYLVWKHEQQHNKKTVAAGVGKTKTTVGGGGKNSQNTTPSKGSSAPKTFQELLSELAKNLPTISSDDEDDDDDDSKPMPEIFRSGHDWENYDEIIRTAEAADAQLQKWQDDEVDFYKKTGKWKTRALKELSKEGVAELLDMLDLAEHKASFKRTDGVILSRMAKDDVIRRFGEDAEAADILWQHVEKAKLMFGDEENDAEVVATTTTATTANSTKQQKTPSKAPAAAQHPPQRGPMTSSMMPPEMREVYESTANSSTSTLAQKRRELDEYEQMMKMQERSSRTMRDTLQSSDPLAEFKRAMFPDRPLRPSQQQQHADPEDVWGEEVLKYSKSSAVPNRYQPFAHERTTLDMSVVQSADVDHALAALDEELQLPRDPPPRAPPTAAQQTRPVTVPAAVQGGNKKHQESTAPKRGGNRWEVVEYSDDEEEN